MNTKMPRREFVQKIGYAGAAMAALPAMSLHAASAPAKPVVLAFVGCAHIHTPGFITVLEQAQGCSGQIRLGS
jgi:hypothetical protein